jgi:hypothetical protein
VTEQVGEFEEYDPAVWDAGGDDGSTREHDPTLEDDAPPTVDHHEVEEKKGEPDREPGWWMADNADGQPAQDEASSLPEVDTDEEPDDRSDIDSADDYEGYVQQSDEVVRFDDPEVVLLKHEVEMPWVFHSGSDPDEDKYVPSDDDGLYFTEEPDDATSNVPDPPWLAANLSLEAPQDLSWRREELRREAIGEPPLSIGGPAPTKRMKHKRRGRPGEAPR